MKGIFMCNQRVIHATLTAAVTLLLGCATPPEANHPAATRQADTGWQKYERTLIGGDLGTVFDVSVLRNDGHYRMWASWRPKKSLALFESPDGINWGEPVIVLGPNSTYWEEDINRPVVLRRGQMYHMWYTGQAKGQSWIGYATSDDGVSWERQSPEPVISPDVEWEKTSVMCPFVLWDEAQGIYRMWYSGGDQYEPDAMGYATSKDGIHWTKLAANPVFRPDTRYEWEQHKVTAGQVVLVDGWHYMFYIGFRDVDHAQIGLARSKDGVADWERFPSNPIISPTPDGWDADACYKPYVVDDGGRWLLWYNGRRESLEQIGMAVFDGGRFW